MPDKRLQSLRKAPRCGSLDRSSACRGFNLVHGLPVGGCCKNLRIRSDSLPLNPQHTPEVDDRFVDLVRRGNRGEHLVAQNFAAALPQTMHLGTQAAFRQAKLRRRLRHQWRVQAARKELPEIGPRFLPPSSDDFRADSLDHPLKKSLSPLPIKRLRERSSFGWEIFLRRFLQREDRCIAAALFRHELVAFIAQKAPKDREKKSAELAPPALRAAQRGVCHQIPEKRLCLILRFLAGSARRAYRQINWPPVKLAEFLHGPAGGLISLQCRLGENCPTCIGKWHCLAFLISFPLGSRVFVRSR